MLHGERIIALHDKKEKTYQEWKEFIEIFFIPCDNEDIANASNDSERERFKKYTKSCGRKNMEQDCCLSEDQIDSLLKIQENVWIQSQS